MGNPDSKGLRCQWHQENTKKKLRKDKENSMKNEEKLVDIQPVTVAQYNNYLRCIGQTMRGEEFPNHPVTNVDYQEATNYCEWAGARLPTEQEWLDSQHTFIPIVTYDWLSTMEGNCQVLRTGSWYRLRDNVDCANRNYSRPSNRDSFLGFRCVRGKL